MKTLMHHLVAQVARRVRGRILQDCKKMLLKVTASIVVLLMSASINTAAAIGAVTTISKSNVYEGAVGKLCLDNKFVPYITYNLYGGYPPGASSVQLLPCDGSPSQNWQISGSQIYHPSDNTCMQLNPVLGPIQAFQKVNVPRDFSAYRAANSVFYNTSNAIFYTTACDLNNPNQGFLIDGESIRVLNEDNGSYGIGNPINTVYPYPVCLSAAQYGFLGEPYLTNGLPDLMPGPVIMTQCNSATPTGLFYDKWVNGAPWTGSTVPVFSHDKWTFGPGANDYSAAGSAIGCTFGFKPGRTYTLDLVAENGLTTAQTFIAKDTETGLCLTQGDWDRPCDVKRADQRHDMNNATVAAWVSATKQADGLNPVVVMSLPPTPLYGTKPNQPGYWQQGVQFACDGFSAVTTKTDSGTVRALIAEPHQFAIDATQKGLADMLVAPPPLTAQDNTKLALIENDVTKDNAEKLLETLDYGASVATSIDPTSGARSLNLHKGSDGIRKIAEEIQAIFVPNPDLLALDVMDAAGPAAWVLIKGINSASCLTFSKFWLAEAQPTNSCPGTRTQYTGGSTTVLGSLQLRFIFNLIRPRGFIVNRPASNVIPSDKLLDIMNGNVRIMIPLLQQSYNTTGENIRNGMYNNSVMSWTDNLFCFQLAAEIDYNALRNTIKNIPALANSLIIPQPSLGAEAIFSFSSRYGTTLNPLNGVNTRLDAITLNLLADLDMEGGAYTGGFGKNKMGGLIGKFINLQRASRTNFFTNRFQAKYPDYVFKGSWTTPKGFVTNIGTAVTTTWQRILGKVTAVKKPDSTTAELSVEKAINSSLASYDLAFRRLNKPNELTATVGDSTLLVNLLIEAGVGLRWFNTSFLDEVECRNLAVTNNTDAKLCGYNKVRVRWQSNTLYGRPDVINPYFMAQVNMQGGRSTAIRFDRTELALGAVVPRLQFNSVSGSWIAFNKKAAMAMTAGFAAY
jgi:hypothetical protein